MTMIMNKKKNTRKLSDKIFISEFIRKKKIHKSIETKTLLKFTPTNVHTGNDEHTRSGGTHCIVLIHFLIRSLA